MVCRCSIEDDSLEVLKESILSLTAIYADKFFRSAQFIAGKTQIPVSGKLLNSQDLQALVESSLDGWLTAGRFTKDFERALAQYVGARYSLFVNSGSSANLIALSGLTSKKLGDQAIRSGDEIITVAMGFPTTVNPIIQLGLIPVFVDIDLETLNIIPEQVEQAITSRTRGIMIAHTLGNPFDIEAIQKICQKHDLWLIEDSCDALGSTYQGRKTGSFGDTASVSFYPAHHITTGEGGAVFVKSPLVKKQVESFRDWGRDCYCETGKDNTCAKRFEWKLGDLPFGYDHKYIYSHIGYNLKATDMQAALGLSQISRLDHFVDKRRKNFQYLYEGLSELDEFALAKATPGSDPAWFGFPITLRSSKQGQRENLLRYLNQQNIGTRLIFAGNITKQPAYQGIASRRIGELPNTDVVMEQSFWIGVYPGLSEEMLNFVIDTIQGFFRKRG